MNIFNLFPMLLLSLPAHARDFSVMTYNIRYDNPADGENRWEKRKDLLSAQIRFYEPDILGVQEALPGQVSDLAVSLPEYNYVGTGRDEKGAGEASDIYYKKDGYIVKDSGTFWLSETPDKVSRGWDAACNRICTYALFRDVQAKKNFWVFNTHLDHQGEEARTKGIKLILAKIAALNVKKYPVILMGDFNMGPGDARIDSLKKEMSDSREAAEEKPFGPGGTFNDFKPAVSPELIDYVFLSKEGKLRAKKYAILEDPQEGRYPSDHFPVFAALELR